MNAQGRSVACDEVRRALIAGPMGPRADLREHLDGCAACRRIADEVATGDTAVRAWLEDFERGGDFDGAWEVAIGQPVVRRDRERSGRWVALATVIAVAVAFGAGWGLSQRARDTGEAAYGGASEAPAPRESESVFVLSPGTATAPEPPTVVTCSSLVTIEPMAMVGKLTPDHVSCLEARYVTGSAGARADVSRVLLDNAWAAGDAGDWERLVARHFEEVSADDPELAYRTAVLLSRRQPERVDAIVKWSDLALARADGWTEPTRASRVRALEAIRAAALAP